MDSKTCPKCGSPMNTDKVLACYTPVSMVTPDQFIGDRWKLSTVLVAVTWSFTERRARFCGLSRFVIEDAFTSVNSRLHQ
jgi:hypothetical protein